MTNMKLYVIFNEYNEHNSLLIIIMWWIDECIPLLEVLAVAGCLNQ